MKNFLVFLEGDSAERVQKKKLTITLIYATIAVIACLLITFLVTQIVTSVKDNDTDVAKNDKTISFEAATVGKEELHSGDLLLVNKNNEYFFAHNPAVVSFPVTGNKFGLKDNSLKANPTALAAFTEMMDGLYANVSDANVVIMTAYRTKDYQDSLDNGTPGGYSDFHTGMSFELKDGDTYESVASLDKYAWLYENAHKYGFIVRYPEDTDAKKFSTITGVDDYSYVFRYVGIAHATYIYQNNICLEEYLGALQTLGEGKALAIKGGDGKNYEVYYYPATADSTEIQLPIENEYTLSGDNQSGYIVTVKISKG